MSKLFPSLSEFFFGEREGGGSRLASCPFQGRRCCRFGVLLLRPAEAIQMEAAAAVDMVESDFQCGKSAVRGRIRTRECE